MENEEITSSTSIPEVLPIHEEVILDNLEVDDGVPLLPVVQPVEEAKEETATPYDSMVSFFKSFCNYFSITLYIFLLLIPLFLQPDIEIIEPTMEAVEQSSAILMATIIHVSILTNF